MPTIGSITKTVRINAEDLAVIEKIMADEKVSWSGAIHFLVGNMGTPSKKIQKSEASPNRDLTEVESMANFFGFSLDEFLKMVCEGLTEGVLTIEKGKIVGIPDLDLENFKEACHEMGADPQKVLDKATQGVRRGTL
jgi:hypothetical protein